MKKTMKNTLIAFVLAVAAVALIACGGNNEPTSPTIQTDEGTTSSANPTPAPPTQTTPEVFTEQNIDGTSVQTVEVGDLIDFGGREWRVLDVQDGSALILSDRIVTRRGVHPQNVSITWESSEIRGWLNGSFYQNTFTSDEQARIAETRITNNDHPWFGTPGGINTIDKIFLLSVEEVVNFFGDSGELAIPQPSSHGFISDTYNYARMAFDDGGEAFCWWLRTPGYRSSNVSKVGFDGHLDLHMGGTWLSFDGIGIRPALWLYL